MTKILKLQCLLGFEYLFLTQIFYLNKLPSIMKDSKLFSFMIGKYLNLFINYLCFNVPDRCIFTPTLFILRRLESIETNTWILKLYLPYEFKDVSNHSNWLQRLIKPFHDDFWILWITYFLSLFICNNWDSFYYRDLGHLLDWVGTLRLFKVDWLGVVHQNLVTIIMSMFIILFL